jgi:isopenicillin-N N-acyltransferase like protein
MEGRSVIVGRDGQKLWIWAPDRKFGVVGETGRPLFKGEPDKIDMSRLDPIELPIPAAQASLLPFLCDCTELPAETVDGVACRVVTAKLLPDARKMLKAGEFTLTVWIRDNDSLPARVAYQEKDGEPWTVAIHNPAFRTDVPDSTWSMPAPEGARIDHTALGHLKRFFPAIATVMNTTVPALGPAVGERALVATHGKGRLERHDGTRVLFLEGTPEEMGEQEGVLLKKETRDLVNRVLYGVGIASSFEKGRWFFDEIDDCQAHQAQFVDPRQVREMDAMALAANLDIHEVRMANFFPELFHCSGFALMGKATEGGRIFHGRILDYMRGVGLENNAVVTIRKPDVGYAWVNIGYAGFVGTVTAMNEKHISIGEMGGRGEGRWDGKPMAQLLREVMEKAATLDEAVAILQKGPRTCEYYYVVSDGVHHTAVGVAATPESCQIIHPGESHPRLPHPHDDAVVLSAGDRYEELSRRVTAGFGHFTADSARDLMTRPVCMNSNIHSVLFAPDTLDLWVANSDSEHVASAARYTHYNLGELLHGDPAPQRQARN